VLYYRVEHQYYPAGMPMLKAKTIRLDVSEHDAATLEFMRGANVAGSTTGW
jgi:hypothetical protein